ncbi:MAG TPA: hypothetical protein VH374_26345 [Polyangia bacterium]|nr:hypothetical protein [Polyangia bacterium]
MKFYSVYVPGPRKRDWRSNFSMDTDRQRVIDRAVRELRRAHLRSAEISLFDSITPHATVLIRTGTLTAATRRVVWRKT